MILRTLLSIVYLAVVGVGLVVELVYPAVAGFLLYGLLAWFIATLFLYRLPVMSRRIGARASPSATATPAPPLGSFGTPLPSTSGPVGSFGSLAFCAYCAAPIEPGTPVCPSCGHRIPI